MKLIRAGQPVVRKITRMIDTEEVLWGYLLNANVDTRSAIVMHAFLVNEDETPLQVRCSLDDLIFIDLSPAPK